MEKKQQKYRKGIAVAGIRGGSGKTLISIGIIKALQSRGLSAAPFKKGPDYIDPAWLTLTSKMLCYNLDSFLMEEQDIRNSFLNNNPDSDFAIVEGNRGLFDGVDADGTFSFAELVKLLRIPLFLIVDCTKSSRTVAAIVHGCKTFDMELSISGVILNYLAGERHKNVITESIEKHCGIPVIGAIPRQASLSILERHLGLIPIHEQKNPEQIINDIGDIIEKNVDIGEIIRISEEYAAKVETEESTGGKEENVSQLKQHEVIICPKTRVSENPVLIGVFRDSAFNFYYPENIAELKNAGAEIIELNSFTDKLQRNIDALYIGGGFPETHAEMISGNHSLRGNIKRLIEEGLPVYAECGGLVYLSDSLVIDGEKYPLAGVFPFVFEISKRPVGHGYTVFEVTGTNPYYPVGLTVRGHEFRYSRVVNSGDFGDVTTVFKMHKGKGISGGREGVLYKNTLATFIHTHAFSHNVTWIRSIVEIAKKRRGHNG